MLEVIVLQIKCIIMGIKLHIFASFPKESLPLSEYIGVTHTGMNDGKSIGGYQLS